MHWIHQVTNRGVGVGVVAAGLILWSLILCILDTLAGFGCKALNSRPVESNLCNKSLNNATGMVEVCTYM